MVFNSLVFLAFFSVVFLIYWFPLKNTMKGQNIFLLLASYFFYGYADWKMLPLLIGATVIFYYIGKGIASAKTEKQSYWLTFLGVVLGVGTLLYFKYFNFFIESFAALFEACGLHANLHTFNIIMPLGISFFTFRLLSYVIDIYRGKFEPTNDIIAFGTYVAFFPCLLSGPIDRPMFINQLTNERTFDYNYAVEGGAQIIWGLFKKVVIADNLAYSIDQVWDNIADTNGSTLVIAAFLYSFQMYTDFSGYSDMAIGVGKLLGFNVTKNFNHPFFALNMADFWRRWHMSLTSWLTDYVFMPLNIRFRDWGAYGMILAIIINMIVVGMWHGANWTFAVFGLYHGLLFVPLILSGAFYKKAKIKTNSLGLPVLKDFGRMLLTFMLVTIGLTIFRADNIVQAWTYIIGMCNETILTIPELQGKTEILIACISMILVLITEWRNRDKPILVSRVKQVKQPIVLALAFSVSLFIILMLRGGSVDFVYFQF